MTGFKTFANGEVLNAADVNDLLMRQAVIKVANNTARDAISLPHQGMIVEVAGKGYQEKYYDTWHATNNPGGAKVAGWYPHAGNVPGGMVCRNGVAYSPGVNGYNLVTSAYLSETGVAAQRGNGMAEAFSANNGWKAAIAGIYDVNAFLRMNTGGNTLLMIKRNSTTGDGTGLVLSSTVMNVAGVVWGGLAGRVLLNAGDILRMFILPSASTGNVEVDPYAMTFGVRYAEPIRGV